MSLKTVKSFLRVYFPLIGFACLWYLYDSRYQRNIWFMAVGAALLVAGVLFLLVLRLPEGRSLKSIRGFSRTFFLPFFLVLTLALLVSFFTLRFGPFNYGSGRFLFTLALAGLAALLLAASGDSRSPFANFALFLLVSGVTYRVLGFLPEVSAGPFSLGWSEGSRFYNASAFLSRALYGQNLPLPVLHPTRYLLQAVPFALGIRSILAHRIWQVLLWLGLTAWGAYLLARRFRATLPIAFGWLMAFFFLYFFQGAVYYHLMVCVILVLLGYHKDKPWRTLLFVLLASLWAGISRVNWIPVPALLAVSLHLMDRPFPTRKWLSYFLSPALWTLLGVAVAFGARQAYIAISGEPPALFDSAFSSALLLNRLFPNSTFFLGILPAILLAMLPLGLLCLLKLRSGTLSRVHWLRWLGLAGILAVFLGGGILVSLKIGGGGDLHNLDAFLVFWALITGSLVAGHVAPDHTPDQPAQAAALKVQPAVPVWQPAWLLLLVVVPVFFAFTHTGTWSFAPASAQDADLSQLRSTLVELKDEPGDILFISERQLLVFDELGNIPVVPEYEKVFLMEMAMGDNRPYLQQFYALLASHQFKAIVSDPLSTALQDRGHSFAEENNAWVQKVVLPILADYEPILSLRGGEVNVLVPKGN